MDVLYKDNPVKKQEYIISLAASGKSNREIAEELGYKDVHNLYTFMRRRGMVWSANKRLFVVKGEKEEEPEVTEEKPAGKVGSIISMFEKKMDGKDIAKNLRFSSAQDMADYMKSKGYAWDNKKRNYKKAPVQIEAASAKDCEEPVRQPEHENNGHQCNCMERFGDILRLLEGNKDKLSKLLEVENIPNVPRYTLPGLNVTKSVEIPSILDQLVKDYSRDKNVTQREVMQVALVEFLRKYGYANEVKAVLNVY